MSWQAVFAIFFINLLWARLGTLIHNHFIKKTIALDELTEVSKKRVGGKIKGTVVIAGGSIGGLWSARFASDHFEEVVVVEPETWTLDEEGVQAHYNEAGQPIDTEPEPKRGRVFQYNAIHAFQSFTVSALRKAFPDCDHEARSAHILFGMADTASAASGVLTTPPTEYYPVTEIPQAMRASRAAYERLLRRLVRRDCKNIRWIKGSVTAVVPSPSDRQYLSGVTIQVADEDKTVTQPATLVVDATGGSVNGLKWLKEHDYGKKTGKEGDLTFENFRRSYDHKMRYRCIDWFVPEDLRSSLPTLYGYDQTGFVYGYLPDANVESRNTAFSRVEGHRIQSVFGGWDVPFSITPKTPAEITEWFKATRGEKPVEPWVYSFMDELVKANGYAPDDELPYRDYRAPPCHHFQYHRISDLPSNFVALGDSVMRVNPVAGQGCLKALVGALCLNDVLLHTSIQQRSEKDGDTLPPDFSKRFFSLQAPKLEDFWDSVKYIDYGWSTTTPEEGETRESGKFIRRYALKALALSHFDREVNHILFLSHNYLAPGTDLFKPRIILKVLWYSLSSPFYKWSVADEYRVPSPAVQDSN